MTTVCRVAKSNASKPYVAHIYPSTLTRLIQIAALSIGPDHARVGQPWAVDLFYGVLFKFHAAAQAMDAGVEFSRDDLRPVPLEHPEGEPQSDDEWTTANVTKRFHTLLRAVCQWRKERGLPYAQPLVMYALHRDMDAKLKQLIDAKRKSLSPDPESPTE